MSCTSCGESSCGGGSSCGSCADSCNPCNGPKTIITKQGLKGDVGDLGADGRGYDATSSTCIDVLTTGATSFGPITIEIEKAYSVGARVRFSDPANPSTNYFEGICSAYDPLTGIMTVSPIDLWVGTGTICQWDVNLAGEIGTAGATGSAVTVQDEGITLTTAVTKLDFVGTGVTVTQPVASEMLITIPSTASLITGISGTVDYLARWTPSGTQLGDGTIRDNGVTAAINVAPQVSSQFYINAPAVQDRFFGLSVVNSKVTSGPSGIFVIQSANATTTNAKAIDALISGDATAGTGVAVNGSAQTNTSPDFQTVSSAGDSTGAFFKSNGDTGTHYGVVGQSEAPSNPNVTGTHIGGRFIASDANENYSLQLQDGTEFEGRILSSVTNTGKANWVDRYALDQKTISTLTYNIVLGDNKAYAHFADSTSNTVTITLPDVTNALNPPGRTFLFKRVAGGNNVIIDGNGAQTIDGGLTTTLGALYDYVLLQSDGTQWFIVG